MKINGTFSRKAGFEGFYCGSLMAGGKVRVSHSLLDIFMTHQLLYSPEIYASHDQPTRVGVAEDMRT